jgi:tetratricopeptide (TPR) repeat protein
VLQEALDAMLAGKWVTAQPGQLVEIAVLQARAGDTVSARKTLTRAKDAIESLPDRNPNRAMAWSTLAKGWAEAGEVEELRGVIAALPEPGRNYGGSLELYRNNVILQSATALARTGKGKDALELAKDITGASASADRSRLLRFVALYHAGFGNLKEAYRVLDQLPDASLKIETLAGVIWGLRRNNNEPPQPQTLDVPSESGIALILHRAGDHVGARQCLKRALELAGGIKETEAQARGHASVGRVRPE